MSWTEFHPLVQEATLSPHLPLAFAGPVGSPDHSEAIRHAVWAPRPLICSGRLPLARFVTPPLPGNWSLAGLLGFNRPAPVEETAYNPRTDLGAGK